VDIDGRRVHLDDGTVLAYEVLVAATVGESYDLAAGGQIIFT
jgi:hypothetical protein